MAVFRVVGATGFSGFASFYEEKRVLHEMSKEFCEILLIQKENLRNARSVQRSFHPVFAFTFIFHKMTTKCPQNAKHDVCSSLMSVCFQTEFDVESEVVFFFKFFDECKRNESKGTFTRRFTNCVSCSGDFELHYTLMRAFAW